MIICWLMRCDSGYVSTTEILAHSKRTQLLLISKETLTTAALENHDLRSRNAPELHYCPFRLLEFDFAISQSRLFPLADDSILSNVAISVSEEVMWKPVARVVFRYST